MILAVLIIITNVFLIHALRKLNKLNTVSYKLILPSCVSNICIGILVLVSDTLVYLLTEEDFKGFCVQDMAVIYAFSHNALFMTLAIAVDRYIHLKHPGKYHLVMTSKRAVMMVAFNATLSAALATVLLLGQKYEFIFISQICINVVIAILVVSICGLYIQAYTSVASRVKQSMVAMAPKFGSSIPRRSASQRLSRAALFIVTSLAVCYIPHIVCSTLMYKSHHHNSRWTLIAAFFSQSLIYVNSISEAVFIIIFNTDLRSYARRCICIGQWQSCDNRRTSSTLGTWALNAAISSFRSGG